MTRYRAEPKKFILRFEDYPGLEVVMRSLPVGKVMDMLGLADDFAAGKADAEQVSQLFTVFADRLESWNLDDEHGQAVTADLAGVRTLDSDMFMELFTAWFQSLTTAPPKQLRPSSSGAEASLPMEPLPPSQPS